MLTAYAAPPPGSDTTALRIEKQLYFSDRPK